MGLIGEMCALCCVAITLYLRFHISKPNSGINKFHIHTPLVAKNLYNGAISNQFPPNDNVLNTQKNNTAALYQFSALQIVSQASCHSAHRSQATRASSLKSQFGALDSERDTDKWELVLRGVIMERKVWKEHLMRNNK